MHAKESLSLSDSEHIELIPDIALVQPIDDKMTKQENRHLA